MHDEVRDFFKYLKSKPELAPYFASGNVLEIGARDINGSVRDLFDQDNVKFTGVDLGPGKGVDVIGTLHEASLETGVYSFVFSTEALEHDPWWEKTLVAMWALSSPYGLMAFTCGGPTRGEHGTTAQSPSDSPDTNYWYRNLSIEDVREVLQLDNSRTPMSFHDYEIMYARGQQDLHFWGRIT